MEQESKFQAQEAAIGREVYNLFHNSVEQFGKDCPISIIEFIGDCEDCPLGKVCDMVIELEGLHAGKAVTHD